MRSQLLTGFVVFAALSAMAADAFACKCVGDVDPKDMVIGFWGTVRSLEHKGALDRATFSVDQQFRGEEETTVVVNASRYHHDCGIRFEEGKSYVVYAYDFHPRGVATNQCWYTHQRDEPPTEEEFSKPKLDVTAPTELEKKIRKIADTPVQVCGKGVRVNNSGFSIILSPTGDPVPGELTGKIDNRDQMFQKCVMESLIGDLPPVEKPVRIDGWYQSGDVSIPVMVDELPCDEGCPDWGTQVEESLFDVRAPMEEPLARAKMEELDGFGTRDAQMKAAAAICPFDGLEIAKEVAERTKAPPAKPAEKSRLLARCAITRGEFAEALTHAAGLENDILASVVEWASEVGSTEKPYPLRTGAPGFPAWWFENNSDTYKDNHRVLRSTILHANEWANDPLFLEAFAEAIVDDEEAGPLMRDYAALAYHKAALLRPASKEGYDRLATQIEKSPRYSELQGKLDEAFKQAQALRANELAEVEALAEDDGEFEEEVVQKKKNKIDPMWLVLGAMVLIVIAAGAFQRLKRG